MKILDRLKSLLGMPTAPEFHTTDDEKFVFKHYFNDNAKDTTFFFPDHEALVDVYMHYDDFQAAHNSPQFENLELSAMYESGKMIDFYAIYHNPVSPDDYVPIKQAQIKFEDAQALIESFKAIAAPCVKEDYMIHFYGGALKGTGAWHTDDSGYPDDMNEVTGILPLDKTHLTTIFKDKDNKERRAPENCISFIGTQAVHRDAGESRPTLQITSL